MPTSDPVETTLASNNAEKQDTNLPRQSFGLNEIRNTHDIIILICLAGSVGAFFAPWASFDEYISGANFYRFEVFGSFFWAIPILSIATLAFFRNRNMRRLFGTFTAIASWAALAYFIIKVLPQGMSHLSWGASLSLIFSFSLFVIFEERGNLLSADFVARKLKARTAEIYSHWGAPAAGIHFSAQEFYAKIENAIYAKQWPGVQMLRIHYTEGGILSNKREYLRVIRHRHLFDICAATFGTDSFFTMREGQIPSEITARVMVVVVLALGLLATACIQLLGILFGGFALLFILILGIWFLFNIMKMGLTNVDAALIRLPVLGTIYERWFRRDTFFQQDTRMVFLQSINELVKSMVEETTSSKGLKYLDCFERQPILDGLYKRSRTQLNPSPEPTSTS